MLARTIPSSISPKSTLLLVCGFSYYAAGFSPPLDPPNTRVTISISTAIANVTAPVAPTLNIVSFGSPGTPKTLRRYIDANAVIIHEAALIFSLVFGLRMARFL